MYASCGSLLRVPHYTPTQLLFSHKTRKPQTQRNTCEINTAWPDRLKSTQSAQNEITYQLHYSLTFLHRVCIWFLIRTEGNNGTAHLSNMQSYQIHGSWYYLCLKTNIKTVCKCTHVCVTLIYPMKPTKRYHGTHRKWIKYDELYQILSLTQENAVDLYSSGRVP